MDKKIYVGPNLTEGRMSFARVLINGYPPDVQAIINKNPWFARLFVSIDHFSTAVKLTGKKGTPLNTYYNRARSL